jgi:hypothetical protein
MSNENNLDNFFNVKKTETEASLLQKKLNEQLKTEEYKGLIPAALERLRQQQQM